MKKLLITTMVLTGALIFFAYPALAADASDDCSVYCLCADQNLPVNTGDTCDPGCTLQSNCSSVGSGTTADETTGTGLEKLQKEAGVALNPAHFTGASDFIGRAIRLLFAFIGSIALLFYIWAGFTWMTSAGNAEKVNQAKSIVIWTTMGVVAMMAAYVLTSFVFKLF